MTRHLCRECRLDLTQLFYERYGDAIKDIYPQVKAITDDLANRGATNIEAKYTKVGAVITCPRCHMTNEIILDSMEQIKGMILEMNR